jgi:hypothetical protein
LVFPNHDFSNGLYIQYTYFYFAIQACHGGAREGTGAARRPNRVTGLPGRATDSPAAGRRGQKSRRWRSLTSLAVGDR